MLHCRYLCLPRVLHLQVLLANVLVKIGAVFTVALPLVWLGGLLYHCTSGESLQISLFKVYAVLYRAPGTLHLAPTAAWSTSVVMFWIVMSHSSMVPDFSPTRLEDCPRAEHTLEHALLSAHLKLAYAFLELLCTPMACALGSEL